VNAIELRSLANGYERGVDDAQVVGR
jgi:hypothetical protein